MSVLKIDQLTKHYGRITALKALSFTVEPGMVYGLLGPNGSGKTTTLGILLGIIHQDQGSFQWFNGEFDPNPRKRLGALLETPNFYPYLDAVDNLQIVAQIKEIKKPKIDHLLKIVDLFQRRYSKFKTYSLGMKQRLAIAAAMIGDPEVLIFDEPTNGLDPQGIAEVRQTILEIAQSGKTILLASHILDEVEKICSHVAIIKNGHLLATGPIGAIINNDILVEVSAANNEKLQAFFEQQSFVRKAELKEDKLLLHLKEDLSNGQINKLAFETGFTLNHLIRQQKSLEAEFLEITSELSHPNKV